MNPDNYTKEDLNANAEAARATWAAATADAADAAANNAAEYAAEYNAGAAKHWVNRYFDLTGENRHGYIDAINKAQKTSKKKKGNTVEFEIKIISHVPYSENKCDIAYGRCKRFLRGSQTSKTLKFNDFALLINRCKSGVQARLLPLSDESNQQG